VEMSFWDTYCTLVRQSRTFRALRLLTFFPLVELLACLAVAKLFARIFAEIPGVTWRMTRKPIQRVIFVTKLREEK